MLQLDHSAALCIDVAHTAFFAPMVSVDNFVKGIACVQSIKDLGQHPKDGKWDGRDADKKIKDCNKVLRNMEIRTKHVEIKKGKNAGTFRNHG